MIKIVSITMILIIITTIKMIIITKLTDKII